MTVTDDDLGARLRVALQEISPLATDPLPPPRFAPDAEVGASAVAAGPPDLLVVGGGTGDRVPRRPGRRVAVAAAVLAAAATTAGVLVATTDLGRGRSSAVPPGSPVASSEQPIETNGVLPPGIIPDSVPWRCTAPAGATLSASLVPDASAPQVWQVGAGVTCAAHPADRGRFVIAAGGRGVSVPGTPPATFGVSASCVTAATQLQDSGFNLLRLTSRGAADYLEFFGPNCRLLLPAK